MVECNQHEDIVYGLYGFTTGVSIHIHVSQPKAGVEFPRAAVVICHAFSQKRNKTATLKTIICLAVQDNSCGMPYKSRGRKGIVLPTERVMMTTHIGT